MQSRISTSCEANCDFGVVESFRMQVKPTKSWNVIALSMPVAAYAILSIGTIADLYVFLFHSTNHYTLMELHNSHVFFIFVSVSSLLPHSILLNNRYTQWSYRHDLQCNCASFRWCLLWSNTYFVQLCFVDLNAMAYTESHINSENCFFQWLKMHSSDPVTIRRILIWRMEFVLKFVDFRWFIFFLAKSWLECNLNNYQFGN